MHLRKHSFAEHVAQKLKEKWPLRLSKDTVRLREPRIDSRLTSDCRPPSGIARKERPQLCRTPVDECFEEVPDGFDILAHRLSQQCGFGDSQGEASQSSPYAKHCSAID